MRESGWRFACSGEQYAGVIPPQLIRMLCPAPPPSHSPAAARARARPKSLTFATPSLVSRTLPGLTSWWIRPRSWSACKPKANWMAMSRIWSSRVSLCLAIQSASEPPSTYSAKMAIRSLTVRKNRQVARWGCSGRSIQTCSSSRKLRRLASSPGRDSKMVFRANRWPVDWLRTR